MLKPFVHGSPLRVAARLLALAAFATTPSFAHAHHDAEGPLAIGSDAPETDVTMQGTDGKKHSVSSAAGTKGTLVVFTCNHCPYVKAWEERITAIGNAALGQGVGVIAINSNDPAKKPEDSLGAMKKRAKKLGLKFPYVVDKGSKQAHAYGATKTPEAFLFDAAGKLVYHGAIDDNYSEPDKVTARYLHDAVNAVAKGEAVANPTTKALGCSIKPYKKS